MKFIFEWKKYLTSERTSVSKIKKIKEKQRNDVSDIFSSEDMENMSLVSRMQFRMENTSCRFFGKTLISSSSSIQNLLCTFLQGILTFSLK